MKCPTSVRFLVLLLFVRFADVVVYGQLVVGAKAGIIQYAQGDVSLDGNAVKLSKGGFLEVHAGQAFQTRLGFVELVLGPDVYLRMGIFGTLRIDQNRLDDTRLTLEKGSAIVEIVQEAKGVQTRLRLAKGDVEIRKKGLYRFDADSGEIRIYGGSAQVSSTRRKATVGNGRKVTLDADLDVRRFDAKEGDSLHQWAARRSFEIYQILSSPRVQNNWQRLSLGWAVSSNFRMRFFSERLLQEWKQNQHVSLDAKIAADLERKRMEDERAYLELQAARARQEMEAARNSSAR